MTATATLLISCPDQPGIVAGVAEFIYRYGGNIIHADQHTDHSAGAFFQRVEFELDRFGLGRGELEPALQPLVERFGMTLDVRFSDKPKQVGILVSKQGHCLLDLLSRYQLGELPCHLSLVISNHPDHGDVVAAAGVPFHHLPVTRETKARQERDMEQLLDDAGVDVVVLARYMQILSDGFVTPRFGAVINIHHSFLPAFVGAKPYHQAHERGVKLIGATAHYATADLDEGPIIDQGVERVSHRDTVDELVRKGRDLETVVLARALRAHLEDRVLLFGNKTVVF